MPIVPVTTQSNCRSTSAHEFGSARLYAGLLCSEALFISHLFHQNGIYCFNVIGLKSVYGCTQAAGHSGGGDRRGRRDFHVALCIYAISLTCHVVVVLVVCFQSLTLTDAQLKYFNTGRLISLYLLSTNTTIFSVNFLPYTIQFKIWDSFASLLMVSHDVHISV